MTLPYTARKYHAVCKELVGRVRFAVQSHDGHMKKPIRSIIMHMPLWLRDVVLAVIGGLLLGAGAAYPPLWFCALFGFAPLLFLVWRQSTTPLRALVLGTGTGFIGYGLSLYTQFWDTLPLPWLANAPAYVEIAIVGFAWFISVTIFALSVGLFALIARLLRTGTGMDILLVVAAWPLADWAGAWLFYLLQYDPQMLPGPHFAIGAFAYQLAGNTVLVQAAWFGGLYALDALMMCMAACIARARTMTRASLFALGVGAILLYGSVYAYLAHTPSGAYADTRAFSVVIIPADNPAIAQISSEEKWKRILIAAVQVHLIDHADIIVLPEGTDLLGKLHAVHGSLDAILSAGVKAQAQGPLIIDSSDVSIGRDTYASTIEYRDQKTWTSAFRTKEFLEPFGEVLPFIYKPIARALGQGTVLDTFLAAQHFIRAQAPQAPVEFDGVRVMALVCSDGISPLLYSQKVRDGAQILFNLSSQSWFHSSPRMDTLAQRIATVRAVESRRWFALAANDGTSFVLDPYGRMVASMAATSTNFLTATMYGRSDMTPFSVLGAFVLCIPALAWIFVLVRARRIARR